MSPPDVTALPRAASDRIEALDVVRGAALGGVLLVNLVTDFRAPFVRYLALFHTTSWWCDRAVDLALGVAVESKALALYSFLFGVGVAMQSARVPRAEAFLARRFAVLAAIGVAHLTLVWNGDILTAYALCGAAMIPLARRGPRVVVGAAVVCLAAYVAPWTMPDPVPHGAALERATAAAMRAYGHGSWRDVVAFRARETLDLIVPLEAQVFPRTLGLALLGVQAWRSVLSASSAVRGRALRRARAVGLGVGGVAAVAAAVAATRGVSFGAWGRLVDATSTIPLALGYGASLWLWSERPGRSRRLAPIAAAGRMSLTNYLAQSVTFGAVFYGYGLGLYGRLGPAATALFGLAAYAAQCALSAWWLRRHAMGPMEQLWRAASYGRAVTR